MDYFDHSETYRKTLEFINNQNDNIKYLVISFTSDEVLNKVENSIESATNKLLN